jgi:hypothetical protein
MYQDVIQLEEHESKTEEEEPWVDRLRGSVAGKLTQNGKVYGSRRAKICLEVLKKNHRKSQ